MTGKTPPKEKRLIYQYYISPPEEKELPEWAAISQERLRKYAKMHGAEYTFERKTAYSSYYFAHLCLIYDDKFKKYDKILYVDADVIVENFDENIFDNHVDDIAAVPEYRVPGMVRDPSFMTDVWEKEYRLLADHFECPIHKPKSIEAPYLMFNSGVLLWSRAGLHAARKKFMNWKKWYNRGVKQLGLDQPYLNSQITKHLKYNELSFKWNCLPRTIFEPDQYPKVNFVHYTFTKKDQIPGLYGVKPNDEQK